MKNRTIYLGFSTSKCWNPFSWLIKTWWGTPYSHVYLRWETPWGFDEILEASGTSIHMVEKTYWERKNKIIKEIPIIMPQQTWNQVMIELRSKTGRPYGWGQIFGLMWRELWGLKSNPIKDGAHSWNCSEVGYRFLQITGILVLDTNHRDDVTPKDIWDITHGL